LEQSLSPVIHAAALRASELQGEFLLYPIPHLPEGEQALKALLNDLRASKVDGLNVTIPHKQSVLSHLDRLTPVVEEVGAVNTILRVEGVLVGDNTDVTGFLKDLAATLSPTTSGALILGAGGAARAVAYGLCKEDWKVWIASRRPDQAVELVRSMRACSHLISPISLEAGAIEPILTEITLIVNATPLGMAPNLDATPWPMELPFPADAVIYDLVCVPQETSLVRLAAKNGLRATTGLGMLLEQAALAFELWTRQRAPRRAMRSAARAAYVQLNRTGGS
jgi:shikimate dehydrogenase